VGGFYGRTLSDGLLIYGEAALQQNPAGRYPRWDPNPMGIDMAERRDRGILLGTFLWGAAYTLLSGPTLTAEYLYFGPGYDSEQADLFFDLQANNYLMLQAVQNEIADAVNLTLRITCNLDDGSKQLTTIGEWYVGDYLQLFAIGTLDSGSQRSEFGSVLAYQLMAGIEVAF
jgi:hypothetical protein